MARSYNCASAFNLCCGERCLINFDLLSADSVYVAEKSPSVMLPAHLEKLLFSALDAEVDSDIAAHIQATLGCLLEAGAPDQVPGNSVMQSQHFVGCLLASQSQGQDNRAKSCFCCWVTNHHALR